MCSAKNAIIVPDDAPLELLGPLGCGIQTGAGAVLNALRVTAGSTFVVFGSGAVGMSAIMAARVAGATKIVAFDKNADRLKLTLTIGATDTVDASLENAVDRLKELSPSGFDFALDTTGIPAVIDTAISILGRRGTCGLLAGPPGLNATLPVNQIFSGGQTIRGITEGDSVPSKFIPQLIELHRQGRFPIDKIITRFPFAQINEAISAAATGVAIKPVVYF